MTVPWHSHAARSRPDHVRAHRGPRRCGLEISRHAAGRGCSRALVNHSLKKPAPMRVPAIVAAVFLALALVLWGVAAGARSFVASAWYSALQVSAGRLSIPDGQERSFDVTNVSNHDVANVAVSGGGSGY